LSLPLVSRYSHYRPLPPSPYTTLFRSDRGCEATLAGYDAGMTANPPDPQPETTPGLEPGGSVTPGDTPPIESSTSATNYRQPDRSEEHTSELQSPDHLVCRLLLEKKNY